MFKCAKVNFYWTKNLILWPNPRIGYIVPSLSCCEKRPETNWDLRDTNAWLHDAVAFHFYIITVIRVQQIKL